MNRRGSRPAYSIEVVFRFVFVQLIRFPKGQLTTIRWIFNLFIFLIQKTKGSSANLELLNKSIITITIIIIKAPLILCLFLPKENMEWMSRNVGVTPFIIIKKRIKIMFIEVTWISVVCVVSIVLFK